MTFMSPLSAVAIIIGGILALLDLYAARIDDSLLASIAQRGNRIVEFLTWLEQHGGMELKRDERGRVVGITRSPLRRAVQAELETYLLDPISSQEPLSNPRLKLTAHRSSGKLTFVRFRRLRRSLGAPR